MNMPAVGTMWRSTQSGELYRVLHVDTQRVLLQGDVQTVRVPTYSWPSDLEPVIEVPQGGDAEATVALLVGGAEGHHFDRLWDQAAELGIDVAYHWNGELSRLPSKIPVDVQLVIILVSHISHRPYDEAKSMARTKDLPLVHVPSGGFKPSLQAELAKIGFEGFGAFSGRLEHRGHYSWTGSTYEWREPSMSILPPPHLQNTSSSSGEGAALGGVVLAIIAGWSLLK